MIDLDDQQRAIIDKVEKLLRLANKNPNEAEAAAATQKAQELLSAYNLDMAMVGEHGGTDGRREQAKLKGGAYQHQRELWWHVAALNFCLHWCDQKYVTYKVNRKDWDGTRRLMNWQRLQWHHFLVGRAVNVAATKVMSEYLEGAIERAVRERLKDSNGYVPNTMLYSKWAVSFRKGAVARITDKLEERRSEVLAEERRKKREAERSGQGTSNALTLSAYVDAEHDANMDFIYGEGWSAKQAAARARQAAAEREAEEAYTRWAAANPEEAAAEEAKRRKEAEKRSKRKHRPRREKESNVDSHAYWSGFEAAESISIDQQAGHDKVGGLLK